MWYIKDNKIFLYNTIIGQNGTFFEWEGDKVVPFSEIPEAGLFKNDVEKIIIHGDFLIFPDRQVAFHRNGCTVVFKNTDVMINATGIIDCTYPLVEVTESRTGDPRVAYVFEIDENGNYCPPGWGVRNGRKTTLVQTTDPYSVEDRVKKFMEIFKIMPTNITDRACYHHWLHLEDDKHVYLGSYTRMSVDAIDPSEPNPDVFPVGMITITKDSPPKQIEHVEKFIGPLAGEHYRISAEVFMGILCSVTIIFVYDNKKIATIKIERKNMKMNEFSKVIRTLASGRPRKGHPPYRTLQIYNAYASITLGKEKYTIAIKHGYTIDFPEPVKYVRGRQQKLTKYMINTAKYYTRIGHKILINSEFGLVTEKDGKYHVIFFGKDEKIVFDKKKYPNVFDALSTLDTHYKLNIKYDYLPMVTIMLNNEFFEYPYTPQNIPKIQKLREIAENEYAPALVGNVIIPKKFAEDDETFKLCLEITKDYPPLTWILSNNYLIVPYLYKVTHFEIPFPKTRLTDKLLEEASKIGLYRLNMNNVKVIKIQPKRPSVLNITARSSDASVNSKYN